MPALRSFKRRTGSTMLYFLERSDGSWTVFRHNPNGQETVKDIRSVILVGDRIRDMHVQTEVKSVDAEC